MSKIIRDSDHHSQDDIWTHWFKCPKCEETMIMIGASYCQDCGVKLKWDLKESYE